MILIITCLVFSVRLTVTWLVSWWWPCLETWSVLKIWLEVWKCPSCLHHPLIFPGATRINYDQGIRFWIGHKNSTFSDIHCSSTKIFWAPFKNSLLCKSVLPRMERLGQIDLCLMFYCFISIDMYSYRDLKIKFPIVRCHPACLSLISTKWLIDTPTEWAGGERQSLQFYAVPCC